MRRRLRAPHDAASLVICAMLVVVFGFAVALMRTCPYAAKKDTGNIEQHITADTRRARLKLVPSLTDARGSSVVA